MSVAARVLAGLGEGLRTQTGTLLPALVAALVADAEPVDAVVSGADGWAVAFDLDRTLFPAWLGQLAGVTPVGGTLQQQRDAVLARGTTRGTVSALKAAARATLTGGQRVTLTERAEGAYRFEVVTYDPQTPSPAATLAALLTVKPAGLVLTYASSPGQTYRDVQSSTRTYQQIKDSAVTYDQFRQVIPSG